MKRTNTGEKQVTAVAHDGMNTQESATIRRSTKHVVEQANEIPNVSQLTINN